MSVNLKYAQAVKKHTVWIWWYSQTHLGSPSQHRIQVSIDLILDAVKVHLHFSQAPNGIGVMFEPSLKRNTIKLAGEV